MQDIAPSKTPLPWFAFVIVGVLISGYAKFVQWRNPESSAMTLFFYIGLAIGLFGLGKYALNKKMGQENKQVKQEQKRYAHQLERQKQQWQQQRQQPPAQHSIIHCPKCGTKHYAASNFCHKCGSRLK